MTDRMTKASDNLVERLQDLLKRLESRDVAVPQEERGGWKLYENEAALYELKQLAPDMAREIVAQAHRITALREALRPFAEHPDFHASDDWAVTIIDEDERSPGVTAGDFRNARAALTTDEGEEG